MYLRNIKLKKYSWVFWLGLMLKKLQIDQLIIFTNNIEEIFCLKSTCTMCCCTTENKEQGLKLLKACCVMLISPWNMTLHTYKINNQHVLFNTISSKTSHLMNSNISSLFSKWFEPKLACVVNSSLWNGTSKKKV